MLWPAPTYVLPWHRPCPQTKAARGIRYGAVGRRTACSRCGAARVALRPASSETILCPRWLIGCMRQRVTFRFLRTMRSLRRPLFGARSGACSRARSRSRSRACSRGGDGRLGVETYTLVSLTMCELYAVHGGRVCICYGCLLACTGCAWRGASCGVAA